MCEELIGKLQELVEIYRQMYTVTTGESSRDDGFEEAFDIVVSDLRTLIEDYREYRFGPPHIPIGFRLHAVTH